MSISISLLILFAIISLIAVFYFMGKSHGKKEVEDKVELKVKNKIIEEIKKQEVKNDETEKKYDALHEFAVDSTK